MVLEAIFWDCLEWCVGVSSSTCHRQARRSPAMLNRAEHSSMPEAGGWCWNAGGAKVVEEEEDTRESFS
jgi:3',5'-cyclic AMP phosphodiesterase CpdA